MNDIVIKAVAVALRNVPEANGKILIMITAQSYISPMRRQLFFFLTENCVVGGRFYLLGLIIYSLHLKLRVQSDFHVFLKIY